MTQRPPFQAEATGPSSPFTQGQPSQGESMGELKTRSQRFRVDIRNRAVRQMRERVRQEMMMIEHIEATIQQRPDSIRHSLAWAQELMISLKEVPDYEIPIHEVLMIFRELERFPYLNMLRMFRVVLMRSSKKAVDEMFQYNILGLFYGIIDRAQRNTSFTSMNECEGDMDDGSRVELIRLSLLCMAELCEKAEHVRNFTVINHKAVVKCTRIFKEEKTVILPEYLAFLKATTTFPFRRHQQAYIKITSSVLSLFARHPFHEELNWVGSSNQEALICSQLLVEAVTNLLSMDCGWITPKIMRLAVENQQNYLYSVTLLILRHYNMTLSNNQCECEGSQAGLLSETIRLSIKYAECSLVDQDPLHLHELYFELMSLLTINQTVLMSDQFTVSRAGILFSLSNYFTDCKVYMQVIPAQLHFYGRQPAQNLINVLSRLLSAERNPAAYKQLLYLIGKIITNLPIHFIQPFLLPTDLFTGLFLRITGPPLTMNNSLPFESMISDILQHFLDRVDAIPGRREQYRKLLWSAYGEAINDKIMMYFSAPFGRDPNGTVHEPYMREGLELILALISPENGEDSVL